MLKKSLLNAMAETEDRSGNAYVWTERIYGQLAIDIQKGKLISHFDLSETIFECRHFEVEYDPQTTFKQHQCLTKRALKPCCIKKLIILEMCRVITEWLAQNKRELVGMTYGKHRVSCIGKVILFRGSEKK